MNENKDTALSFFNHFRAELRSFIGLDLEFIPSNKEHELIEYQLQSNSIQDVLVHKLFDRLLGKVTTVLSNYYDRSAEFELQQLISVVEEIALLIIFHPHIDKQKKLKPYAFVKLLKDISTKTYESAHTALGFFYFKAKSSDIQQELSSYPFEYIPLEFPIDIRGFIADKRSLKLVDNEHISLVVNHNFFVTGFVRRQTECNTIRSVVLNLYNEIDEWQLRQLYYEGMYEYISCKTTKEEFESTAYEQFMSDIHMQLQKINKRNREKKKAFPSFQFIDINNSDINWYTDHNFTLRLSNGSWKVKHYLAFKSMFLEIFLPYNNKEMVSFLMKGTSAFHQSLIDLTVKRIDKMVNLIKRLGQAGKGALFIILCDSPCGATHEPVLFNTALQQIPASMLLRGSTSLQKFTPIIKQEDYALNILRCDLSYLELISTIDGAVIFDSSFNILSFGELLDVSNVRTEALGARTAAAYAGSRFGIAVKVSQDGDVVMLQNGKTLIEI
ncbi:hypothetical protein [Bacillus sp. 165]|uniref:hypothetical protein n=1 Tax=Bacillus sp. 165 TaxID=1529117 RepID=UPI001ADD253A|nr:hypothetical protein [Bacillus sp. 165]MBO9128121.1 hypothetical protein [Bacillus sp. 165]